MDMSPDSRGERLQIMLSAEELQVVDEFRFKQHMPSRAAAVRELLKRGLAAEGFAAAVFGSKSSEYGVTGDSPNGDRHANGKGNGKRSGK
jgi:hypothetical protein